MMTKRTTVFALLAMIWLATPQTFAGPLLTAATGACLASGTGDRFITHTPAGGKTCAQACAAIACGTPATCAKGWTTYGNAAMYHYGTECTKPGETNWNGSGMLCCCTGTGCAQALAPGTAYNY